MGCARTRAREHTCVFVSSVGSTGTSSPCRRDVGLREGLHLHPARREDGTADRGTPDRAPPPPTRSGRKHRRRGVCVAVSSGDESRVDAHDVGTWWEWGHRRGRIGEHLDLPPRPVRVPPPAPVVGQGLRGSGSRLVPVKDPGPRSDPDRRNVGRGRSLRVTRERQRSRDLVLVGTRWGIPSAGQGGWGRREERPQVRPGGRRDHSWGRSLGSSGPMNPPDRGPRAHECTEDRDGVGDSWRRASGGARSVPLSSLARHLDVSVVLS